MLTPSERKTLELLASRFGVAASRVQRTADLLVQHRKQGQAPDVFDLILKERLLSPSEIHTLQVRLEQTQLDPLGKPDVLPAVALPDLHQLKTLGEFRILRRLGTGGMGAVFLAFHNLEKQPYALKVLDPYIAQNPAFLDRFYREARMGKLLHHPHLVRNLNFGKDQATSLHYLVLEYVEGISALELLERVQRIALGACLFLMRDIARGLEYLHQRQIIHRDVKPSNILIMPQGRAKLADLGLAKRTDDVSQLTGLTQGPGTPHYMPPEQALNPKKIDLTCDLYALGATLYHLLTGDLPFVGANSVEIVYKKSLGEYTPLSTLLPQVPRVLDEVVARLMATLPAERYQSAAQVIEAFEATGLIGSAPDFSAITGFSSHDSWTTDWLSTQPDAR